jgi:CrcB protein
MGGPLSWLAVGFGATLGAWLRWAVSERLAALHGLIPAGTLLVNLAGGYLIGLLLGAFGSHPSIAPEWRLFLITGFLGGLTTFSAFSGESLLLLERGAYGWALAHSAAHLLGSIACSIAGYATWKALAS